METCVAAHRDCLSNPSPSGMVPGGRRTGLPSAAGRLGARRRAERTKAAHALVHELFTQGHSRRAISRHLGWEIDTVLRYVNAARWQDTMRDNRPRPSRLAPYKPYRERRFAAGCTSAIHLHRELLADNVPVTYQMVRAHIATLRAASANAPPRPLTSRLRRLRPIAAAHPRTPADGAAPRVRHRRHAQRRPFKDEREIQLNLDAPHGGAYVGPTEIAVGRHRLHELCGYTSADHSSFKFYADGPTRVVVEATNDGTDLAGNPWSMTVVELVDVIDGKIAKKRTSVQAAFVLRALEAFLDLSAAAGDTYEVGDGGVQGCAGEVVGEFVGPAMLRRASIQRCGWARRRRTRTAGRRAAAQS